MYLAGFEVWHSRGFAPTRRLALGEIDLPMDPAPGLGGLLLAAVVSANFRHIDEDLMPDVHRLVDQIVRGNRIVQPRLRHRYQVDRHGLSRSIHSLHGDGDVLEFDFDDHGTPLQNVLGAVYVRERFGSSKREVQRQFRNRLRDVHPDYGGADEVASELIAQITEARRILTEAVQ